MRLTVNFAFLSMILDYERRQENNVDVESYIVIDYNIAVIRATYVHISDILLYARIITFLCDITDLNGRAIMELRCILDVTRKRVTFR